MRPDQKRIFKLISRTQAVERTLASVGEWTQEDETVAVEESCERILSEDISAPHDLPPHDKAAMDGYAVRSKDTAGASGSSPITLVITGKVFPPDRPGTAKISEGECIYTSTGAPLPDGSDAVVEVEKTRLVEEVIEVVRPVALGENVTLKGAEVRQGETLFTRGHIVAPQGIGMLLSLGIRSVKVVKKPRVGIISVGDELVDPHEEGTHGKVVSDHAYIVCELLRQLGAEPEIHGVVPDDPEMIKSKITGAVRESDIVVTIAGSSVGARDFVPDVLESVGRMIFHGISITPGKVAGVGMIDKKPVVMLPGYLMSALAGFYLFVVPLVNRLLRIGLDSGLPVLEATLDRPARAKHGLERFQLLQLRRRGGSYVATPVEAKLGAVAHIKEANAYTIVPKGQIFRRGKRVTATLLAPSELQRVLL